MFITGTQIFYLIDEKVHSVGKGANSVTSMLHNHCECLGYGETNAVLLMLKILKIIEKLSFEIKFLFSLY